MTRLVVIALVFAGACVALLVWIASSAQDRADLQDRVLEDGGRSLAGRKGGPSEVVIPKDRPRDAAHVLLSIALPPGDPRARAGGATVLSLRGNGVAYRRAPLDKAVWAKHLIATPRVEALLADAAALPAKAAPERGGGWVVTLDLGKGREHRTLDAEAAAELLAAAEGRASAWVPEAASLRTAPAPAGSALGDLPPWPDDLAGLEPPEHYAGAGADFRAPTAVMKRALERLAPDALFRHGEDAWRVEGIAVAFP